MLGRQPKPYSPILGQLGALCQWLVCHSPHFKSTNHKNYCDQSFSGRKTTFLLQYKDKPNELSDPGEVYHPFPFNPLFLYAAARGVKTETFLYALQ